MRTYNRIVKTFQARSEIAAPVLVRPDIMNKLLRDVAVKVENEMIERGYRRVSSIRTQEAFDQLVGGCHEFCPARKDPEAEHDHGPPRIIPYVCFASARGYYVGKRC